MHNVKCHNCRRAKEKLFLKGARCFSPKCSITRNSNTPGVHGQKRARAGSEFGLQLSEKQKLKRSFDLKEKQFRNYFLEADTSKGETAGVLMQLLEMRLDNAAFRLGFAGSRGQARQMVGHGHLTINGKRIDIPSYRVRVGDKIGIRTGSTNKKIFNDLKNILKKYDAPEWLELDKEKLVGTVKRAPAPAEIETSFQMQLITEFYSK